MYVSSTIKTPSYPNLSTKSTTSNKRESLKDGWIMMENVTNIADIEDISNRLNNMSIAPSAPPSTDINADNANNANNVNNTINTINTSNIPNTSNTPNIPNTSNIPNINNTMNISNNINDLNHERAMLDIYNTYYRNLMLACVGGNLNEIMNVEQQLLKIQPYIKYRNHYVDAFVLAATENKCHICRYLYDKYDMITGAQKLPLMSNVPTNLMTSSNAYYSNIPYSNTPFSNVSYPNMGYDVSPDLFITCCKKGCTDVVLWMLSFNTFSIDIIKEAMMSAMLISCTTICSHLYFILATNGYNDTNFMSMFIRSIIENNVHEMIIWFYMTDIHLFYTYAPFIFLDLCYYGRIENIIWLMNLKRDDLSFADTISADYVYKGIVNTCTKDNIQIVTTLCEIYSVHYIISLILADTCRSIYVEAVKYKACNILKWLNNIRTYNVCVNGISTSGKTLFTINSNQTTLVKCADEIIMSIPFNISIIGNNNGLLNHATLLDILLCSIAEINIKKDSIDILLECDQEYTQVYNQIKHAITNDPIELLNFTIKINSFITLKELMEQLYNSGTITDKNIFASMIIDQLRLNIDKNDMLCENTDMLYEIKSAYKILFMDLLDIKMNMTHKITKIYEDIECPMCMGEKDIVLTCGHSMCMSCAYLLYIVNNKDQYCSVCHKNIDLHKSLILI